MKTSEFKIFFLTILVMIQNFLSVYTMSHNAIQFQFHKIFFVNFIKYILVIGMFPLLLIG